MNWLLTTVEIPNWVIIVYWISLGIPLLIIFIFEVKYYSLKFRIRNEKEKEKINKGENPNS